MIISFDKSLAAQEYTKNTEWLNDWLEANLPLSFCVLKHPPLDKNWLENPEYREHYYEVLVSDFKKLLSSLKPDDFLHHRVNNEMYCFTCASWSGITREEILAVTDRLLRTCESHNIAPPRLNNTFKERCFRFLERVFKRDVS